MYAISIFHVPKPAAACRQAGTLLCTRSISFLVGSVLLPHMKAQATTRTSAQQHAKRQRALTAQIRESAAGGALGGGDDAGSHDASPPVIPPVGRRGLMGQLNQTLTGAGSPGRRGGPCTVEPSCDPAVLLAVESGDSMAAARADAQLQQADRAEAPDCSPTAAPPQPHCSPTAATLQPHCSPTAASSTPIPAPSQPHCVSIYRPS